MDCSDENRKLEAGTKQVDCSSLSSASKLSVLSNVSDENEEEDEIVTMVDVLKEQEELEDDANAVLGTVDNHQCTYKKGYVKRQALYSCKTCYTEKNEVAGVCLSCSLNCHEGHDLIELYTKRQFRCDCGNKKFAQKCLMEPEKDAVNEKNQYNQNFTGLYCVCKKPYPDPEGADEDDMLQCVICEDWFHCSHLGSAIPNAEGFDEMVCDRCSNLPILPFTSTVCVSTTATVNGEDCFTPISSHGKECTDFAALMYDGCKPLGVSPGRATFWKKDWRMELCRCDKCLELYKKLNVSFLIDPEDSLRVYEELNKARTRKATNHEVEMKALQSLPHIQQVEAIQGFNTLKTNLTEYLKKFAENKKIVREKDIREFFQDLKRKRQKGEGVPPSHCH